MEIYDYLPFVLFFLAEIALLLCLYRYVLRGWIIEHWEDKIREDEGNWLVDILSPALQSVTDSILESAPDAVLKALKHELLSNQGTLTKVSMADSGNPEEVGLEMAEMALQSLGIKKPGAIMTLRMGKTLLDMYNTKQGAGRGNNLKNSLPTGDELVRSFSK